MADDEKYYELEEAISTLELQIKEGKDKDVVSILEDCKKRLEAEFDEIKDDVESLWEREKARDIKQINEEDNEEDE